MRSVIGTSSSSFERSVPKFFLLLALFGINLPSPGQETTAYSFFVAGHTYGAPGVDNPGFHPPFREAFEYIGEHDGIQFGVLTGDIVSSQPTAEDWDEIDADLEGLGMPVYFAVGNHDVEDRQLFEDRYGPTYYYFTFQNDLFVILDPNLDAWNISGQQLDFLKDLMVNQHRLVDNIFLFFHQIIWREDHNQFQAVRWNSAAGKKGETNFWSEVMPIFGNIPNEVVMFAGDLGAQWASNVMYHHCENVTFIATGMGDGNGDNIIIANVADNKSITFDLICIGDVDRDCLGSLTDYTAGQCIERPENELDIYPNPTSDWLTIKNPKNDGGLIEIFDLSGKLLHTERWIGYKKVIDLSGLQSSLYLIRVTTKDESHRQIISKI